MIRVLLTTGCAAAIVVIASVMWPRAGNSWPSPVCPVGPWEWGAMTVDQYRRRLERTSSFVNNIQLITDRQNPGQEFLTADVDFRATRATFRNGHIQRFTRSYDGPTFLAGLIGPSWPLRLSTVTENLGAPEGWQSGLGRPEFLVLYPREGWVWTVDRGLGPAPTPDAAVFGFTCGQPADSARIADSIGIQGEPVMPWSRPGG
jgi:hypothetical protein